MQTDKSSYYMFKDSECGLRLFLFFFCTGCLLAHVSVRGGERTAGALVTTRGQSSFKNLQRAHVAPIRLRVLSERDEKRGHLADHSFSAE